MKKINSKLFALATVMLINACSSNNNEDISNINNEFLEARKSEVQVNQDEVVNELDLYLSDESASNNSNSVNNNGLTSDDLIIQELQNNGAFNPNDANIIATEEQEVIEDSFAEENTVTKKNPVTKSKPIFKKPVKAISPRLVTKAEVAREKKRELQKNKKVTIKKLSPYEVSVVKSIKLTGRTPEGYEITEIVRDKPYKISLESYSGLTDNQKKHFVNASELFTDRMLNAVREYYGK